MPARDQVDLIIEQWTHERPDLDPAPIGIIGRISRLSRQLELELERVYRDHELEPGWHDVLATLRRQGKPYQLRPGELTESLMLTSSGTTKRLDRLERAGLVRRDPDPTDRRAIVITLTPEGIRRTDAVMTDHLANERRLVAGLSAADRRALADLLRSLQLSLDALA